MHTLNEQNVIITGETADEIIEKIKTWLSEALGWYYEDGIMYIGEEKLLKCEFETLSNKSIKLVFRNRITHTDESALSIPVGDSVTIKYHFSAGESVKYVNINNKFAFIEARAEDEIYIFAVGGSSDTYHIISEESLTCIEISSENFKNQYTKYTTTKMPAIFGGGEMKELFKVISARSFTVSGFNVNFVGGTVHRLVTLGPSASSTKPMFSFPVSD